MNPIIKWPGGKSREIDKIQPLIPEYDRYVEPFFGGGAKHPYCEPKQVQIDILKQQKKDGQKPIFFCWRRGQDRCFGKRQGVFLLKRGFNAKNQNYINCLLAQVCSNPVQATKKDG